MKQKLNYKSYFFTFTEIVPNACERTIPPCGNGSCINAGTDFICLCEPGYTGVNCEIGLFVFL